MKLLIDECLSEELAKLARGRGHPESSHVRWIGKAGKTRRRLTSRLRAMTFRNEPAQPRADNDDQPSCDYCD